MNSKVHVVLRTLHTWIGVTLALLLILASVTGTLLVWKYEYVELRLPHSDTDDHFVATPQTLAAIGRAIEDHYDNNDILQIQFATDDFPFTKVILADEQYAYFNSAGAVVDQFPYNERFEEWLFDLHHRLLLDNFGLTVMGVAALALMIIVVLGVIVFWPLRSAFKRGIWPKGFSRAQLMASHRNLGIVVALPMLLVLLTAALLAFPEQSEELLLWPFRGENYSMDFTEKVDDISGDNTGAWLPTLQRAVAIFPNATIRIATVPNATSPYRVIGLQQTGEWNANGKSQIYIDAKGGWMDLRIDALEQHISERLYNLSYPLHTGRMDNYIYKVFLTLLGLSITALSVLGMVSFIKRYINGKRET